MDNTLWRCSSDGKENVLEDLILSEGIPKAVALYLAARGITAESQSLYFNATLENLCNPFVFKDMDKAVTRLWKAIQDREVILVYGDYDTDGITATALLSQVITQNGGMVVPYLPHRFDNAVGFSPESLDKALAEIPNGKTCGVIVTVDSGINSVDTVKIAAERGIDVIITDHHEPAEELPKACALLNPKTEAESPQLKEILHLSGVGVAFKLAQALFMRNEILNQQTINQMLSEVMDYVALGTVADIVPLVGENRILVRYGMQTLNRQLHPGTCALIEVAIQKNAKTVQKIQPSDITFRLAPRLNAACRLDTASPKDALDLMMADNFQEARRLASKLENYNKIRHDWEREIFAQAKSQVEQESALRNNSTIVAAGENWHQGVVGIVASRFARDYNKPAIVFSIIGNEAHGSGRSVGSINLIEVLSKCSHLLTRHGGHPMAVGVGIEKEKIPAFREAFEQAVQELAKPDDLVSHTNYDGILKLRDFNRDFFEYYEHLAPFGQGNPIPTFLIENVEVYRITKLRYNNVRGMFIDSQGDTFDFMAHNRIPPTGQLIDVIVQPEVFDYYGERRLQLQLQSFRLSQI